MEDDNTPCGFCGKSKKEVRRLIAGDRGACICNECIGLCNGILVDAGDAVPVSLPKPKPESLQMRVEVT